MIEANNEIGILRDRCSQLNEEIGQLKRELESTGEEYDLLAYQSRTVSLHFKAIFNPLERCGDF